MSYKCHYCGYVASKFTNYCVKCGKPRAGEFVVISKGRLKELESNQRKNSNINERTRRILVSETLLIVVSIIMMICFAISCLFYAFDWNLTCGLIFGIIGTSLLLVCLFLVWWHENHK